MPISKCQNAILHNILGDVVRLRMNAAVFEEREQRVERLVGDFRNFVVVLPAEGGRRGGPHARVRAQARQLRRRVTGADHGFEVAASSLKTAVGRRVGGSEMS
jgi:hypothetical protein